MSHVQPNTPKRRPGLRLGDVVCGVREVLAFAAAGAYAVILFLLGRWPTPPRRRPHPVKPPRPRGTTLADRLGPFPSQD